MKLLTTREAAKETGLSEYELRRGQKSGRYPALMLGEEGSRARRLRWNLPILLQAIERQMETGTGEAS